ncbi:MAG: CocE/NonD family hydrolase [Candidatus Helarchaeota archaeon]
MREKIKRNFNIDQVEFAVNIPKFLFNHKGMKQLALFEWNMKIMIPLLDFLQKPFLKSFKYLGSLISKLLGFPRPKYNVIRLKEYLMKKSDGAKECTDIYLPKKVFKNKSKSPTILVRLPYGKDMICLLGYYFASLGYVAIFQDIRGTSNSSEYGTFALTYYMRRDGLETLKWITKRFWYNGKIGTWGLSFFGMTQLSVCWDNDGLITCLNPAICSLTSPVYHNGGMNLYAKKIMGNILFRMIVLKRPKFDELLYDEVGVGDVMKYYYDPMKALYNDPINSSSAIVSLKEMAKFKDDPDKLTSLLNEKFKVNFEFNRPDTENNIKKFLSEAIFQKKLDLNYRFLPYGFGFNGENIETPMLCLGSWHDMFIEQWLIDIKEIQKNSPDYFKKYFKMIIGPGAHGGMDFFYIPYPPQFPQLPVFKHLKDIMALFQNIFPFKWYEYWLKDKNLNLTKIPAFKIWILNKQVWRYSNKWPPKSSELKLYLHSKGNANSKFGDGTLSTNMPDDEPPDAFEFNPIDPVNTRGGRFLILRSGRLNQVKLEERSDILIYTTDELEDGIEVLGEVKIIFYASSSAKDTDFTVKLVDVYNNKKILHVIDNGIRVRFRDGLENPKLITPNKIYKFELYIGATGIYFPKGHRIRIEISSSNFPRFDINSNLAGEKSKKEYKIAHQKIYHDKQHPSYLILPINKPHDINKIKFKKKDLRDIKKQRITPKSVKKKEEFNIQPQKSYDISKCLYCNNKIRKKKLNYLKDGNYIFCSQCLKIIKPEDIKIN